MPIVDDGSFFIVWCMVCVISVIGAPLLWLLIEILTWKPKLEQEKKGKN